VALRSITTPAFRPGFYSIPNQDLRPADARLAAVLRDFVPQIKAVFSIADFAFVVIFFDFETARRVSDSGNPAEEQPPFFREIPT
jgi:hypothetical protein